MESYILIKSGRVYDVYEIVCNHVVTTNWVKLFKPNRIETKLRPSNIDDIK
jgi:hypothetical protein